MSVNVGTAYLEIVPSARGFMGSLQSQIGGSATRAGQDSGRRFGEGMRSSVGGMAKSIVAPLAAAASAVAVKDFLGDSMSEARESQKVGALTTQVIKSTGGAAKVTSAQVGDLATAISNKTGIDDEAIQSGSNLLLTFKNVKNEAGKGNDIFNQSTEIMTDMATAMGKEPKSAAIQLGKALNDPIKGITALSKVGVTFDDVQKKQIKSMVESGNTMGAQKVILKELESEFGGAAAAQATAGDKAAVALGNFKEQIGTALIPVVDKLMNLLSTKVIPAVSGFVTEIQEGTGAGGQFRTVITNIVSAITGVVTWSIKWKDALLPIAGVVGTIVAGWRTYIAVTRIATAVQGLFNAVMAANPIGLTVIAIAALAAGIVIAYKRSETFRNIVNAAFGAVKSVVSSVVGWFISTVVPLFTTTLPNAFGTLLNWVKSHWKIIASLLGGPIVAAVLVIQSNWGKICGFFSAAYNWVKGTFKKSWDSVKGVLSGPIDGAKAAISGAFGKIKGAFTGVAGWVKGGFNKSWSATKGVLTNPIGSAKSAIGGLLGATGLRKPFSAVAAWVKGGFKASWNGSKKVLTDPIGSAKSAIGGLLGATGLRKPFSAVAAWVKGAFKAVWNGVKAVLTAPVKAAELYIGVLMGDKHARAKFRGLSNWVTGAFKAAWNKVKGVLTSPVKAAENAIGRILGADGIQKTFSDAVDAIGRIWSKLSGKVKSPIDDVIGIINKFISGFNNIGKVVGLTIPSIPELADGGTVGSSKNRQASVNARLDRYATGGVIRGPWRGPKADNVLGVSNAGVPTARVNPGEYITNVASTRKMQRRFPGALEHINRTGTLPGFARGGKVSEGGGGFDFSKFPTSGQSWQWQWALVKKHFPDARLTSSYRPGAKTAGYGSTSYHALGRAIDIGGSAKTRTAVAKWLLAHYANASHDLIYTPLWGNSSIYEGKQAHVNAVTAANHRNHVHWGLRLGGGHKGGVLGTLKNLAGDALGFLSSSMFDPIKKVANSALDGIGSKFPGGFAGKFLAGYGKKLVSKAIDYATSFGGGSTSAVGEDGGPANPSGAAAIGKRMAAAMGWTGGNWRSLYKLWQGESGWKYNADNPGSSAYGIPQALPGRKMASAGSDWATNPATQIKWGLSYIKQKYGSPSAAYSKWLSRSPHWYAGGGLVAGNTSKADLIWQRMFEGDPDRFAVGGKVLPYTPPVFDHGGTLAPGLNLVNNQLGRPEALVREDEQYGAPQIYVYESDNGQDSANQIAYAYRQGRVGGKYAGRR